MFENILYRETILICVNFHQGLKLVDLSVCVLGTINPVKFRHEIYMEELNKLVEEGEIVEVCYVLPKLDSSLKSMYFPKGTKVGSYTLE